MLIKGIYSLGEQTTHWLGLLLPAARAYEALSLPSCGGAYGNTFNPSSYRLNNCTVVGNFAQVGAGAGTESQTYNYRVEQLYLNADAAAPNRDNCVLNYCCTTPMPRYVRKESPFASFSVGGDA
jgi:hypothetical protein